MELIKKKGDILFCEHEPGNTLFLIKNGEVRLTKLIMEKVKILAVLKEGDIVGEMAVIKKMPRTATAIAQTDVRLLELDRDNFFKLVQKNPWLGFRLLKLLALRLQDQKRKVQIIARETPEKKILDALLMFNEQGEGKPLSHFSVELETSISDLSSWTGLSLDECFKTLKHLESTKKIAITDEDKIVIQNTESIKTSLRSSSNL